LKYKTFFIDKNRYTQILLNLLGNSLKYSQSNTTVAVTLTNGEDGSLMVKVKDQGIGIPQKDIPYIFERFYRVDKSRTRKTGGLGIGLAIVKDLVTAHGGTISVQSREGKGSIFTLEFPV
jgi:signal transduction histidine kinase